MWKLIHIEICTKDFAGDMEEREKKAEKFSDWRKDSRTLRKHSRRKEKILASAENILPWKETFWKDSPQNKKVLAQFSTFFRHNFGKNLAEKILHPNQFSQSRCEHNFISEGGGIHTLKTFSLELDGILKNLRILRDIRNISWKKNSGRCFKSESNSGRCLDYFS